MKFMCVWRPVLRNMLLTVSKRMDSVSVEETFLRLHPHLSEEMTPILLDLFGIEPLKQTPKGDDSLAFIKREKYPEETVDAILDFVIEVMKKAETATVIVLDSVHLMDGPSWKLLELVHDELTQIVVMLLI